MPAYRFGPPARANTDSFRSEVAAWSDALAVIRRVPSVVTLIASHPFPKFEAGKHAPAAVHAGDPPKGAVEALRTFAVEGEAIEVVGRGAYLHTPVGHGTSKLGEKFDKGIGVASTARNWNTVLML